MVSYGATALAFLGLLLLPLPALPLFVLAAFFLPVF